MVGDKKPVVMESDRATPWGIATLGEDGILDENQRPGVKQIEGLEEALKSKQDTLAGNPGQLIGIGDDGSATATMYPCNPNLLINWYFVGGSSQKQFDNPPVYGCFPVNQRGKIIYSDVGYIIDGWKMVRSAPASTISLTENGLVLSRQDAGWLFIQQRLENPIYLSKQPVTFSALLNGDAYIVAEVNGTQVGELKKYSDSTTGILQTTATLPKMSNTDALTFSIAITRDVGIATATVSAAKLELGPVQTLAHKEGDTWVLNDPPPNYALELAKCQRYQLVIGRSAYKPLGTFLSHDTGGATVFIPLPTTMRNTTPTVKLVGTVRMVKVGPSETSVTYVSDITPTYICCSENYLCAYFTSPSIEAGSYGWVDFENETSYVLIDNNI